MQIIFDFIKNNRFLELFRRYKHIILYLFFGVVSTIVNILIFALCNRIFGFNYQIANIISWIFAVAVAYVTNKIWVFESREKSKSENIREAIYFYFFRIVSLLMEMFCLYLLIDVFDIDEIVSKIVSNTLVVVANYVFSKLIIFKNKSNNM